MDIKTFQDSRTAQLAEFDSRYADLNRQYSTLILAAIQEKDASEQQMLIQQILDINAEMSADVRSMLDVLNKGPTQFSSTVIGGLTDDLIKFQKQYKEVTSAKDKVSTLKRIQTTTTQKLADANHAFMIYVGAIVALCIIIVLLVIRVSWIRTVFDMVSTPSSVR